MFDYIVRFAAAGGGENTLEYRTYAELVEGDGIVPGSEWNGPLVLVTDVIQPALHGRVGIVRAQVVVASPVERRSGRDRRGVRDRRRVSMPVAVERRSGPDRRRAERRLLVH